MVEQERIVKIVFSAIDEFNEQEPQKQLEKALETSLFGQTGQLASLDLVTLIVETEDKIAEELGVTLILADEKAMSQQNSPFRNVEALVNYIAVLLEEDVHK